MILVLYANQLLAALADSLANHFKAQFGHTQFGTDTHLATSLDHEGLAHGVTAPPVRKRPGEDTFWLHSIERR